MDSDLILHVPMDLNQLAPTRKRFASWLGSVGLPTTEIMELVIVVSELVSNAIEASPPGTAVELRATREPDRVRLKVRNRSGDGSVPRVPTRANPDSERGRGLYIVRRLTDGLVFEVTGDETVATCWKHFAPVDASTPDASARQRLR